MTEPKHATRADIEAILRARREGTIESTADVRSIPALPPKKADVPAPPSLQAQSLPAPTPLTEPAPATPAPVPAPTPKASDDEVAKFLEAHLPDLIQAGTALVTPPFQFQEVVKLGQVVSQAVATGLPQVGGLEARTLVVVIVRYVWRTYCVRLLPFYAQPFAGMLEGLIITGLEAAYQLYVKNRK